MPDEQLISTSRIQRIRAQGYCTQTDAQLSSLSVGNRFAYQVCGSIVAIGVATANVPTLAVMSVVAFGGVVLPYHPFDYVYNGLVSDLIQRPKIPPRSKQLKFACSIATLWLMGTIALFHFQMTVVGYVFGGLLVVVAFLVAIFDFCIPSLIYNTFAGTPTGPPEPIPEDR